MAFTGAAVAYTVVGGLVLFSGIRGYTVADTAKAVLTGNLSGLQSTETVSFDDTSSGTPQAGSSNDIVADALKYVGNKYVWGGTPGTTKGVNNGTDCSGFVNMVVGRDMGLSIPGFKAGDYDGSSHGPTTEVWLMWNGANTIPNSQAQAGDLACWVTHMGIFTDSGHVVSSLDTIDGVKLTTVAGATPTGEELHVRRLVDA